ncbi:MULTISPECIES: DUF6040 family protein, partial [Blautia]|uniref:DUF6040 family protein n=1 Tax=Blautia TaxID=572511 RepID=UPI001D892C14
QDKKNPDRHGIRIPVLDESAAVIIYFGESIKKTLSVNLLLLFVLSQGVYVGLRCYLKNQLNTKLY